MNEQFEKALNNLSDIIRKEAPTLKGLDLTGISMRNLRGGWIGE